MADDVTTGAKDATAGAAAGTTPGAADAADTTDGDERSASAPADGAGAERTDEPTTASARERDGDGDGDIVEPQADGPAEAGPVVLAATDGVEIPRQQSAEEAADSGAGDGARA
ncbi:hypothetical protein [Streptomyces sp. MBT97]|uniref:hypothetical protein n=1 Tax=Streptomyces sp. MBT97 TaxID=2800411 RepID=UPI0027DE0C59|nr:hypothetical protein [Streptomyces sp. MBT97]